MAQNISWPVIEVAAPVGGATAANQVLEIAQLTAINANTDGLETSLNEVSTNTLVVAQATGIDNNAVPARVMVVAGATSGGTVQTIETNAAGQVSITDGGGSITVDGTVAATQSGTWNINNVSGTVSLPTGAATETTLAALNTKVPSNLTVSSTRLLVDGSGVTQPVSIAEIFITGQSAQTATINNILTATAGSAASDLANYRTASVQVVSTGTAGTFIFEGSNDNTNFVSIPVWNQLILTGTPITAAITATASQIIYQIPIAFRYLRLRIATTITGGSIQAFSRFSAESYSPGVVNVANATAANLTATVSATNLSTNISQINAITPLMGAGPTGTGSIRTTEANIATATLANVAGSATSVTLLASAAARMGAAFYNDSSASLYLKFGATASTTSFTVLIPPGGYYEMPQPNYSGIIDGIWSSATGNVRVTSW